MSNTQTWCVNCIISLAVFRFNSKTGRTKSIARKTRRYRIEIRPDIHRSHVKNILPTDPWRLATTYDCTFWKYFIASSFQSITLRHWGKYQVELPLHVDSAFSFFMQLFEGLKAYRGVDGKIRVFRPDLNMQRMNGSAIRSRLPTFDGIELIKCINRLISIDQEWVPHSTSASLYIRPALIGIDVSYPLWSLELFIGTTSSYNGILINVK